MFKELLQELMESRKKFFVADSINAPEILGYDEEQLSRVLTESITLTRNLFEEMCEVSETHEDIHGPEYGYCDQEDLCWMRDPETDIYYFYR